MKAICIFIFFLGFFQNVFAAKISGVVTDNKGEFLPFASIMIKGTTQGVTANKDGNYLIELSPGSYTFICQHVGYAREEKQIIVAVENIVLNFQLQLRELILSELVVVKGEDPACEIIRQAIKKRKFYNEQIDSFSVEVYIKGLIRSLTIPQKIFGKEIVRDNFVKEGLDSNGKGILFLSESITKVSKAKPNKIKYEVVSSRQSGGGKGFSFPFFTNIYENNISIFNNSLNPRGFISPIADGAFAFYKYKFEGNFFEDGKMISRIKILPKRKNEPLFSGYIEIVEDDWRIASLDLLATKQYALELLDSFRITQIHIPIEPEIWQVKDQVIYLTANQFGFLMNGIFLNVYSNYNLDPGFEKRKFDRTFMKYDSIYNKKDTSIWNQLRPIPLEKEEKENFNFKDSVSRDERIKSTSSRNIDSLNKHEKKMTLKGIFWSGDQFRFYDTSGVATYSIEPILRKIEYNTVEGVVFNLEQKFEVKSKKGKINFETNWSNRYGMSNKHFNSFADFTLSFRKYNYKNRYLKFSGGKRVVQFNDENPISANSNSRHTLFEKENYSKLYENKFAKIEYNNAFENRLKWNVQALFENRIPLNNTTDFSFFKKGINFTPNHPPELSAFSFEKHQAFVIQLKLNYQPGIRFIEFPNYKIPIPSNQPKFELIYTKGIKNIFGSDVDFDKLKLTMTDEMNLKIGGEFRYRIGASGFLNNRKVEIPDLQHFYGSQTKIIHHYLNSFWLASYYRYSTKEPLFLFAHFEHHFNGLLTNKIPLFNKLKWNLVAGSNALFINKNNFYQDYFIGIENIFKVLRIDFVTARQSLVENSYGIKLGFGGLFGKGLSTSGRSISLAL